MDNQTVFYLTSHQPHLPYLVVSLYTLRKHWDGPVEVHAWKESIGLVRQIAADKRLNIQAIFREPEYRGKNDQFLDKIAVARSYPADSTVLYLDADTSIHGSLHRLFDGAELWGFCATQFCNWMTDWNIPRGRVRTLKEFGIPEDIIERAISAQLPSVNGGVWAARPTSPVLPKWAEWTTKAISTYIADEKVLHLMPVVFPGEVSVLTGGFFNCSTMNSFRPKYISEGDVIINHYHGDSNLRPSKSPLGFQIWWKLFKECVRQNIGGVADWYACVGNKYLNEVLKEHSPFSLEV